MEATVLTTEKDGVLEITLNRPDRLNAFTADLHEGLRAAFAQLRRRAQRGKSFVKSQRQLAR